MPVRHDLYLVQYIVNPGTGWKSPPEMEPNCVAHNFQCVRFDAATGVGLLAMDREASLPIGQLFADPDLETANWLSGIDRWPKDVDADGTVTSYFTASEEQALIDARVKAMG